MAETSEGWDGTINEAGMARILAAAVPPRIESGGALSAVGGQRRVLLEPIVTHHAFIRYVNTSSATFDIPAPAAGRWHLLVQRRDWATNKVTHLLLAADTTSTDNSTLTLPASYPNAFTDQPSVRADLALYWIWVRSTDNLVIIAPIIQSRPYPAISGSFATENSGLTHPGTEGRYIGFTIDTPMPAGTMLHVTAQMEVYAPPGNYGGLLRVTRDGTSTVELGRARWHTHGRGERWLFPIVECTVPIATALPAGTVIGGRLANDSGSAGAVEVWFPRASWFTY